MLKNYMKIAFRNIRKNKAYSFINIAGLAIGMACAILIFMWVTDELSYDNFHKNADNIYRVNKQYEIGGDVDYNPRTPYLLAKTLKQNFAEVKTSTVFYSQSMMIRYKDVMISDNSVCLADSSIFEIFSFKFIEGDPAAALSNPSSIVLSQSTAKKFFGDEDAYGKSLLVENENEYRVTGIIEDIPENSSLKYECFARLENTIPEGMLYSWGSHMFFTFVEFEDNVDINSIEEKFSSILQKELPGEKISLKLQPLSQLYLYAISGEPEGMKYVYFLSIIAVFILLIACINFMNLSTAKSTKRAKEVGIRKVIGAGKRNIAYQFLGESIVYTLIALILAIVIVELFRPAFNTLTEKNVGLDFTNLTFILGLVSITILTGLISGSYPALMLSRMIPVEILKGEKGKGKLNFRNILVIVQFSMAIILLIGTGVIYSQLEFMKNKNLGFDKENVLCLNYNSDITKNYDVFRNRLLNNPSVINVSRSSEIPTEIWSIARGIRWAGKMDEGSAAFGYLSVDYDFIETMKLNVKEGRGFSRDFASDTANFIINEKAKELMGYDEPIGRRFFESESSPNVIIGVVDNFHCLPFTYEIEPMLITFNSRRLYVVLVRVAGNNLNSTINEIENIWDDVSPEFPFEYSFLDESFDSMYKAEIRAGELFKYFVFLSIFISCLGLFGLASFMAEQRRKEIGIRKVMGSSVAEVVGLLSKEFIKWVLISNIIAWPVAYYFMNNWLNTFAYKTQLNIWIFVASGFSALIVAVLTVSYQSIKAAVANPVESIRYE